MSEPITRAGGRLARIMGWYCPMDGTTHTHSGACPSGFRAHIAAIEAEAAADARTDEAVNCLAHAEAHAAEAIAAERARLRKAVDRLYGAFHPAAAVESAPTRHDMVSRAAVLALLEETP